MVVANQEGSGTPQNSQHPPQQQQPPQPPPQPQPHQQQQGVYYGQSVGGQPQMYQQPPQYAGYHHGPPPIVVNPPPVQYPYQQPHHMPPSGPYGQPAMPLGTGMWSTGIFDCAGDCPNFLLSIFLPCITFGQVAEIVDRGASSCGASGGIYGLLCALTGWHFIYSCTYRTKMRRQYGIPGDDVGDCCLHFWCEPCALSQEHRELQARGYDVQLGWHGNMVRMSQGVNMAPPTVPAGMMR